MPEWVTRRGVLAIHDAQIHEHGGPAGLRDSNMLESALARPENLLAYGEPDLPDLAAAYAFGLAKNHAFVDGNKRTSFAVCVAFLAANGLRLPVDDDANIATWLALAAGSMSEADVSAWLRARIQPLG